MSSVPWQHLGIDLNAVVPDADLDHDLELDLMPPVQNPVADVYLNNTLDKDDVKEGVLDLNDPVIFDSNEQDQEVALCLISTHHLNESTNNGQVVLLPDLNDIPGTVGAGIVHQGPVGAPRTRRHYSDDTKRAVYAMLLQGSQGGRLPVGLTHQVSLAMDVSLRCVQRIWNAGQKGGGIHAVANKKANCGRKRIEIRPEAITAIPL